MRNIIAAIMFALLPLGTAAAQAEFLATRDGLALTKAFTSFPRLALPQIAHMFKRDRHFEPIWSRVSRWSADRDRCLADGANKSSDSLCSLTVRVEVMDRPSCRCWPGRT
jgi:hypothetical protein